MRRLGLERYEAAFSENEIDGHRPAKLDGGGPKGPTPVDSIEPCHHLSARMLWSAGCIYAGRRSSLERKRPVVAVPVTKPAPATTGRLYVGALEKAAGVEAEFEAAQNTETPLEFLLKSMRDTAAEPPDCSQRARRRHHSDPELAGTGSLIS